MIVFSSIIIASNVQAQTTTPTTDPGILDSLKNFFKFFEDIIKFLEISFEWIAAIFKDPLGFLNQCINWIIDLFAAILPSSPDSIKISTQVNSITNLTPGIGSGIIREMYNSFAQLAGFALIIKVYKLIPFKAT